MSFIVISPKIGAWRRVNGAAIPGAGWSRRAFQPVLADGVRFAYYLLLVLMKSNTFLVPDIFNYQQHPFTSIAGVEQPSDSI
jgi:hypothetical protein